MRWTLLIILPLAAVGALRVYYAITEALSLYALDRRRASRAEMIVAMAVKLCDGNKDQAELVLIAAADQLGRR